MANKKRKNVSKALALLRHPPYNDPVNVEEIKRRRESLGLTMAEAAKRAGWKTLQTWSGIERGMRTDPQVSTLLRVATVLGCKVDDILRK